MKWLVLCLLCLNLLCHYSTWVQVSSVFFKVDRDTDYLDRGAERNDRYICHRLDDLEGKLDSILSREKE